MKKTFFVILIALFIITCATKNSIVKYKTLDFEEKIPLIENDPDSIHYHLELHFTELTDYPNKKTLELVKQNLNKQFFDCKNQTLTNKPEENFKLMIQSIAPDYRKEGLELKKEFGEMSYMLNYQLIKSSKVVYNANKVLSLELETYIYSGGAHGLGNKTYLHYDMKTGEPFGFKEIFFDGAKEVINELLLERCNIMKADEDNMLFQDAKPKVNDSFYFDDEKLYFLYNPYEIAPYAAGYVVIDIPLKAVNRWIDKKGPLGFARN